MPLTWLHGHFYHNKHYVMSLKIKGMNWNVSLDQFEEILKKGCFFCSNPYSEMGKMKMYSESKERIKTYRLYGLEFRKENTISLCNKCYPMVKKNSIIPLAKQILHICSKIDDNKNNKNVEYLDAFADYTTQHSYNWYIENTAKTHYIKSQNYDRYIKEKESRKIEKYDESQDLKDSFSLDDVDPEYLDLLEYVENLSPEELEEMDLKQLKELESKLKNSADLNNPEKHKQYKHYIYEKEYNELIHKNCVFCDRPDTTTNRNNITVRKDKRPDYSGYNELNKNYITICGPCSALYGCFRTDEEFRTHIKKCAKNIEGELGKYIKNKVFIKNSTLYINHSDKVDKEGNKISFKNSNVRIDNLELGIWDVKFSMKDKEPLIDIVHEFYVEEVDEEEKKNNKKYNKKYYKIEEREEYKHDTNIITRGSNFIDSIYLTPYKLQKSVLCENTFNIFTDMSKNIDTVIKEKKYPGFVREDSGVYVGVPCSNTKMKIVLDYDVSVKRIRFYCDYKSLSLCDCNNGCHTCINTIRKAVLGNIGENIPLHAYPNADEVYKFVKNTKISYGYSVNKIELVQKEGETNEDFKKRRKREADKIRNRERFMGGKREILLQKKREDQKRIRRKAGIKERKPIGSEPKVYMQSFKERQIEKYGVEGFKELKNLQQKIARAKKRNNFPPTLLKKLEDEYEKLKNKE